jgi:ribosomal protein S18 acetylase RimI-like enzyme
LETEERLTMTTPDGDPFVVVPMDDSQRSGAVVTLARAFQGDPGLAFLFPDELSRAHAALAIMASVLADAAPFGEVWVARAGAAIASVAAWLPPGAYPRGARRETIGVLRDLRSAPRIGRRVVAAGRMYRALDQAHAGIAQPHWYLAVIGSDPAWQRGGAGSALLAPVLERADRESLSSYLETENAENLAWYRRHGFEIVDELRPRGCPQMWAMRRDPR